MSWKFELVDGPYGGVTEGPAWDGSGLLFTHIPASRILRYDPLTRKTSVHRQRTNCANGLMFDAQGRLFAWLGNDELLTVSIIMAMGSVASLVLFLLLPEREGDDIVRPKTES